MACIVRVLAIGFALVVLQAGPAEARRVALVIGNASYKIGPLANPLNDAAAFAEALDRQLRFDKVILKRNLTFDGFRAALIEMAREAAGAELGLVYFAGHGTEVAGRNFLIPVDATLATASSLDVEAIPLDTVLSQLGGVRKLKLVILDACRNNPFVLPGAKRSVGRGLARIEPEDNTLVAYAAKDGTTADDGPGRRHSPYTAGLLKHIATANLEVRLLFGRVRDEVMAATRSVQQPHIYQSLGGQEFYLQPQTGWLPLPAPQPPAPAAQQQLGEAERAWAAVKDAADARDLEAFRRQYGPANPLYDRLAERRIEEVKKQQIALDVPPPAPKPDASSAVRSLTAAEERALRAKDSFKECDLCPEMVVVPAGSFMMGSSEAEIAAINAAIPEVRAHSPQDLFIEEVPRHKVTFARPFAIGKFEVTFAEWDACVAAGGCKYRPRDAGWGRGRRPVINVSWYDITKEYLPWLSGKTGKSYRLPTEAEWEYAARAGTTTPFWTGSSISKHQASFSFQSTKDIFCCFQQKSTAPVDSFPANPWGLFNVLGNAEEWVQDCWNKTYRGAPSDGSAWTTGDCTSRGLRGGHWRGPLPQFVRSAARSRALPHERGPDERGFRVARTLDH